MSQIFGTFLEHRHSSDKSVQSIIPSQTFDWGTIIDWSMHMKHFLALYEDPGDILKSLSSSTS